MSDSPVIAFLNKMTDLIVLNACWIICSLPIVTMGASTTAMYYVCIISIRQGDGYVIRRFFQSFFRNFKQATLLWLIVLGCGIILTLDIFFWCQLGTGFARIMLVLSMAVAFMVCLVLQYLFPLLSRFDGKIGEQFKNAAAFAVGYLPYSLLLIVISVGFCYFNLISVQMNLVTCFVGISVFAYIKSFFIYKVMMNHMDEKYDDWWNSEKKENKTEREEER